MDSIDPDVERYLGELAEIGAWLADMSAPRPPRRPGLMLHADDPSCPPAFVVRRWFTHDDRRAERDEILMPGRGFWVSLTDPEWLVEDGFLERLAERAHALRCGCRRLWGSADAFEAHGCAELPPVEQGGRADGEEPTLAGRDAEIVRVWNSGTKAGQLAEIHGVEKKTMENRIGELRKKHGPAVVLPSRERRTTRGTG
jgi:hypothetical protein